MDGLTRALVWSLLLLTWIFITFGIIGLIERLAATP